MWNGCSQYQDIIENKLDEPEVVIVDPRYITFVESKEYKKAK